jgi:hypothetical protein
LCKCEKCHCSDCIKIVNASFGEGGNLIWRCFNCDSIGMENLSSNGEIIWFKDEEEMFLFKSECKKESIKV